MENVGVKLMMDPDLIGKLSTERKLWSAAHDDGSKSRINGDTVMEAAIQEASVIGTTTLTILGAFFVWIRKKIRNKGKSKEELAAEKEAREINKTCTALEAMLLDYIRSAQEGNIDEETLDDLIGTLEKMHGYDQAEKLMIPVKEDLAEIRNSIAKYTAVIEESKSLRPVSETGTTGKDEFSLIRDQLFRQKELIRQT